MEDPEVIIVVIGTISLIIAFITCVINIVYR